MSVRVSAFGIDCDKRPPTEIDVSLVRRGVKKALALSSLRAP